MALFLPLVDFPKIFYESAHPVRECSMPLPYFKIKKKRLQLNIDIRITNLIKNVSSATSHTKKSLSLIMSLRIYEIYYPFSTFI